MRQKVMYGTLECLVAPRYSGFRATIDVRD